MSGERRISPRHPVDFSLQVSLDGSEQVFTAQANTLSRTSVEIGCHADLVTALLQQPRLPQFCFLEFSFGKSASQFLLDAQVVTHRRLSQHQYALVLLFRHNDADQENLLDSLLDPVSPA